MIEVTEPDGAVRPQAIEGPSPTHVCPSKMSYRNCKDLDGAIGRFGGEAIVALLREQVKDVSHPQNMKRGHYQGHP